MQCHFKHRPLVYRGTYRNRSGGFDCACDPRKKDLLIAAKGAASRFSVGQVKCRDDFMNIVQNGPEKKFACQIWLCESQPTSVLVQPALCAHSVTTFTEYAVVVGWEASKFGDIARHIELLSHYSIELRKGHRKYLEGISREEAEKVCHVIDAKYGSNDIRLFSAAGN